MTTLPFPQAVTAEAARLQQARRPLAAALALSAYVLAGLALLLGPRRVAETRRVHAVSVALSETAAPPPPPAPGGGRPGPAAPALPTPATEAPAASLPPSSPLPPVAEATAPSTAGASGTGPSTGFGGASGVGAPGGPGGIPGGAAGGLQGGQLGGVLPPRFDAAYLQNPEPEYPSLSHRLGEEGRVLLRVLVSPEGRPDQVELKQSSGSQRLDQAALQTVRRWRFQPARRGAELLAAWVLVPITFHLDA